MKINTQRKNFRHPLSTARPWKGCSNENKNPNLVMVEGLNCVKWAYLQHSFGANTASSIQQGKKKNKLGSVFN